MVVDDVVVEGRLDELEYFSDFLPPIASPAVGYHLSIANKLLEFSKGRARNRRQRCGLQMSLFDDIEILRIHRVLEFGEYGSEMRQTADAGYTLLAEDDFIEVTLK